MSEQEIKKFEELAKPLIKFLNDTFHPHVNIIITPTSAEIFTGEAAVHTNEFIKD